MIEKKTRILRCSVCFADIESKIYTNKNIYDHFEQVHSINIQSKSITLGSAEEFKTWKMSEETDSKSFFIQMRAPRTTKNGIVTEYICNRSGYFKSKGHNLRHSKLKGSNKINGFCPASIKVQENYGVLHVLYTYTHVGHQHELGHLTIPKTDREMLAQKIASKIPFDSILDEVRQSIPDNKLSRLHLLTRQDLFNIEHGYKLNGKSIRHKNDPISVDAWVQEMGASVLFYKPQEVVSTEHPTLQLEDFFLVIMTQDQKEMLNTYGSDCICVDSTHGLNGCGFELHTILVLDELREGFPAAFFISNRSDEEAINIFIGYVKKALGMQIQPHVFMSDMASNYYNAWLQVMLPANFRYAFEPKIQVLGDFESTAGVSMRSTCDE